MQSESHDNENLRWLLWQEEVERGNWPTVVTRWLDCSDERAATLLRGAELTLLELQKLAAVSGRNEEELKFTRLALQEERKVMIQNNLKYLFETSPEFKNDIALQIQVHRSNLSAWTKGKATPTPQNLEAIQRAFLLAPDLDLEQDPVFLSWRPISDGQRRLWLQKQIENMDALTLRDLFPALERLLER